MAASPSSTSLALIVLLAACTLRPQPTPQRLSLDRHACQHPDFTPLLPADDFQLGQKPILAGATVVSGDFLISLWLHCDPSISSDDPEEAEFSEVRYLGFRWEWHYLGRPIDSDAKTIVTVNGERMSSGGSGPGVGGGDISTHTGLIRTQSQAVSRALRASKPVEFLLTISAPEPLAAAVLRVTFEAGPQGLQLTSAEVEADALPK